MAMLRLNAPTAEEKTEEQQSEQEDDDDSRHQASLQRSGFHHVASSQIGALSGVEGIDGVFPFCFKIWLSFSVLIVFVEQTPCLFVHFCRHFHFRNARVGRVALVVIAMPHEGGRHEFRSRQSQKAVQTLKNGTFDPRPTLHVTLVLCFFVILGYNDGHALYGREVYKVERRIVEDSTTIVVNQGQQPTPVAT